MHCRKQTITFWKEYNNKETCIIAKHERTGEFIREQLIVKDILPYFLIKAKHNKTEKTVSDWQRKTEKQEIKSEKKLQWNANYGIALHTDTQKKSFDKNKCFKLNTKAMYKNLKSTSWMKRIINKPNRNKEQKN